MKRQYLLLPLVLGYLLGLLLMIPARFVIDWLPLSSEVSLQGVSGTLWQGQVQTLALGKQQVGPISWNWRSTALLEGKIAADIALADPRIINGRGIIGWNGEWSIQEATLRFPAAVLGNAMSLSAKLGGEVSAHLTLLRFTPRNCIEALADMRWSNGNLVDIAATVNTGDTRLRIKCVNQQWLADITQTSEQLHSKGQLRLQGAQQYRLQGEVTPGATFPPALLMLLAQSAGHESQGRYTFETSGRW
ncbi:type II secretion system protein N [Buttiauxella noackiae]|uniref:type II secretion system protein N n=1 Tax=Buttiauxella noackiae TaxID=82992 RepID=UPI0035A70F47